MVALSVLKPTEREILEGNKLALTSSDQSPINCEKEKDKTSKNWRRCQPNLKRAFLQKKSLRNIVCVLKDGTGDALLELAPISQDTCTGQTKVNLDLIWKHFVSFVYLLNLFQRGPTNVSLMCQSCPTVVPKLSYPSFFCVVRSGAKVLSM